MKEQEYLPPKVTKGDVDNGVEDEYGVVYSRDGKRLVSGTYSLKDYTVKKGTKVICDKAFLNQYGKSRLTSINLPKGLTSIGDSAFEGCYNLTSIKLPKGLITIGYDAFLHCDRLTAIELPESLQEIKGNPFVGCYNVKFTSKSPFFKVENGLLIQENKVITVSGNPTSIIVPDYITSIGENAFFCSDLTSIELPESLQEIKGNPFEGCYNVKITSKSPHFKVENGLLIQENKVITVSGNPTSIIVPDYITSIEDGIFHTCSNLTSIVLPKGLKSIGEKAFFYCTNLTSVRIPNSVTEIGDRAFEGCKDLTSIELPDSVTEIKAGAFWGCSSLTSIELPDGVEYIGKWAFYGCKSLTSIELPDSVTTIEAYAFDGCKNLTSIVLPEGLTFIGEREFRGCSNLTSITLPNSVTTIGPNAFLWCFSLEKIRIVCSVDTKESDIIKKFKKLLPKNLRGKIKVVKQ